MGILNPLYDAVSWIIVQFHSFYGLIFDKDSGWAWGLSIVSLVVLIRICLIPLFVKQIKSTRNMQALQPKMKAIQERYKNDRQRQSEEMMKLYRETGTNPLSSCLPIIAQSPFFFALYHVLSNISKGKPVGVIHQNLVTSAQDAHIFGAPLASKFTDSAAHAVSLGSTVTNVRVVTILMIILMSASQFYTQRQLMTKNVDMTVKTPFMQQQKMLMYVFPLIFAVLGINFPVGVLIYWLTTNVWTMGQQMFVIRRNPTPGSLAFQQRQERLRAKGKLVEAPEEVKAKEAVEAARANRTQPKRQTKAQRSGSGSGAAAGTTHTGGAPRAGAQKSAEGDAHEGSAHEGSAHEGGAHEGSAHEGPQDGTSKANGTGTPKANGAPRAGQARKPGAPRAGGAKQRGGAASTSAGKQSGTDGKGAKGKPTNLSKKK
ncbi:membrane protein insertase YidC [Actinacidiphila acididurans]|uniref:Membrane protein insertase YidC n=1 Tax=Actinacidiphila acididurans TaxID=2784346 RepID=A0ABS2TRJ0_9ACTN|nr:membrane protein insertase YidC [Actinacidiphila acididurans]